TQSPFFGIFLFAVGSSWVGKKGVPITKEYAGLKKQRDNLIENFLK
ncbi:hypothetical protein HY837_04065, partial [archaeon]|nr:hypothetical protein [archaeon]